MNDHPKILEELKDYALSLGASRAAVLPASALTVKTSAWAKCFIPGCKFYGSSIMCPPHNPLTPDITRQIVREYGHGLLFGLEVAVEDFVGPDWRQRHLAAERRHKEMVALIEGRAFHEGYPLALGFAAGECSLCLPDKKCAVLEGSECVHPLRARPAMEACGFDVFSIAQRLDWPLVPIGHRSEVKSVACASLIGLVLVV